MQNDDFTQATRMFHSGQYDEGLQKISNCILVNPQHSMLYSNRALFYYQMKSNEKAIEDLETAIEINYLNYIAYFNLFSIQLRVGGLEREAFEDLCCSLSILYFLRGKTKKSQIDIQKSLKYCENNVEAHILKGMFHLEKNKLKLASNEIEWALEFQPQNIVLKRLKYFISSQIGYSNQDEQEPITNPFDSKEKYQPKKRRRLECSIDVEESINFQQQIHEKLLQFTEIYNDLNCQNGTVTQRILIENDQHLHSETSILSQVSGIWQGHKKQNIFVKNDGRQISFCKKELKNQESHCEKPLKHEEEEFVIYDQILLKEFDPNQQEGDNILQNSQTKLQFNDSLGQINDSMDGFQTEVHQRLQNSAQFFKQVSQQPDYFTMNERQDFLNNSLQDKQQSIDIPYGLINKKFHKKDEDLKTSPNSEYQEKQLEKKQCQTAESLEAIPKPQILEQNFFLLPEPKLIESTQSKSEERIENFPQIPSHDSFKGSEKSLEEKYGVELQETGNTGNQTDQTSDAILSYSSETKILSNYGEILTKQNKNIQFHESQVMEHQTPVQQVDQNGEITLIDDLISEDSQRSPPKQNLENSTSFTKKNNVQEKLKEIKDRVVKSLDNSMKKRFSKDEEKPETKTEQDDRSVHKMEIVSLYPFTPKKQVAFTINSVEFSKKYKLSQLEQLYLVAVYHLSIPKYKMKTQPKKMEGTFCNWNQKFPEMNLLEQPRNLKLTVFNKAKGMKNRDELLGEAQKQVTQTGQIRIPLYDKKLLVGYVKYGVWAF